MKDFLVALSAVALFTTVMVGLISFLVFINSRDGVELGTGLDDFGQICIMHKPKMTFDYQKRCYKVPDDTQNTVLGLHTASESSSMR